MKHTHRSQAGDTIVEVLIAVAVISLMLASAFVVVNRSIKSSRQTQERSEALKLLEGQVERLKVLASDTSSGVFVRTAPFCIEGSVIKDESDAACIKGSSKYQLSLDRVSANTFSATASWDGIHGYKENINIMYKLYQ